MREEREREGGRKEGRKEGRKDGRKEGRKEGRKRDKRCEIMYRTRAITQYPCRQLTTDIVWFTQG